MSIVKRSTMQERAPSDASLFNRVALGDTEALGVLYDRYAPALLRFARRIERREAEDIVQIVFMRVLQLAPDFDAKATSARPWLYGITVRVAMEQRRSLFRWKNALTNLTEQPATVASDATVSDLRHDLRTRLSRLSTAKRTVLVLAEVEGFSCEEIAKMLAIPVGTVWTRLHHARRELRNSQEDEP